MATASRPSTLQQAIVYFSDPENAFREAVKLRWPDGEVVCPHCGSTEVYFVESRKVWMCKHKHPKQQFSVKVGSIMEDSAIGLDKWLIAIWLISSAKNGISSYELARAIGVTQKSAWFMLHRIRLAMQGEDGGKLSGTVEIDETYIGGKARNMHYGKRQRVLGGNKGGHNGKVAVMGLLQRHGGEDANSKVRLRIVERVRRDHLMPHIVENVAPLTTVYTDTLPSYDKLPESFMHQFVNHAECYAEGQVHTNGLENFWSLLKRTIAGTYVSVEPFHLFRYLDEQAHRFNTRKLSDAARFAVTAASIFGKRLTFNELTAADATC
ncbi:MAG: IS1595 family transposase [Vicinamibacterales bacterium]